MIREVVCPACEKVIGSVNDVERRELIKKHIKKAHPVLFVDLLDRAGKIRLMLEEFNDLTNNVSYQIFLCE